MKLKRIRQSGLTLPTAHCQSHCRAEPGAILEKIQRIHVAVPSGEKVEEGRVRGLHSQTPLVFTPLPPHVVGGRVHGRIPSTERLRNCTKSNASTSPSLSKSNGLFATIVNT